jgi:hypothetical protein
MKGYGDVREQNGDNGRSPACHAHLFVGLALLLLSPCERFARKALTIGAWASRSLHATALRRSCVARLKDRGGRIRFRPLIQENLQPCFEAG